MLRSAIVVVAAALAVVGSAVALPGAAQAETLSATTGYDVSYPQCDGTAHLPSTPAFAIIGVNNGRPNAANACLAQQIDWATSHATGAVSSQAPLEYYVNTANPGPGPNTAWWPTSSATRNGPAVTTNPYGTCTGAHTRACSYVYGYSVAWDDVHNYGIADSTTRWWLDVESANTWRADDRVSNAAVLEGMATRFAEEGGTVGVYANRNDWSTIVGTLTATSALHGLPSWIALGPTTQAKASLACSGAPLIPDGRIALTQFVTDWYSTRSIDADVACREFSETARPTISGTPAIGRTLAASTGTWVPAVGTASWQWMRGGVAIAGATKSTYTVTTADKGHTIQVRLTASRSMYDATTTTSLSTPLIGLAFSSTVPPTISAETASSGRDILRAHPGTWKPAATFAYQWYRNGVAIAGETSSVHYLTDDDTATTLTVKVAGTRSGYTTVVRTSAGYRIPG